MAGKNAESIYKVIEVIGTSSKSWADAGKNAVETASKKLRNLRVAEVVKLDMKVSGKQLTTAHCCVSRLSMNSDWKSIEMPLVSRAAAS